MKGPMVSLLCFLWCASAAMAAEAGNPSLFFTADEMDRIQAAVRHAARAPADNGDLRLGAVFYYDADDWALWLQGQKWTPSTSRDDIQVMEVAPDYVRLRLAAASGLEAREIVLKPYQTYQLSTGDVVEGSADGWSEDLSR